MKVEVFDDAGRPVRGEKGELVCTAPFPSMPVGFWNDADGAKYRAAYFDKFPGVWCHGDYIEDTAHGGFMIYGRSDAVFNPGRRAHRHRRDLPPGRAARRSGREPRHRPGLAPGAPHRRARGAVRAAARRHLRSTTRSPRKSSAGSATTPRRATCPARIVQVADIPRTKSGKIVELAVRNVVHGRPVKNLEALANPEALEHYRNRTELAS